MNITDPGFQDFRSDASCQIRPQSLIGEKFVDCRPTLPRAPGSAAAAAAEADPLRRAGRRPVPAAARQQRHQRRPGPDQRHPVAALRAALPAHLQRTRRRPGRPRRRPRSPGQARQPGPARRRPPLRHPLRPARPAGPAGQRLRGDPRPARARARPRRRLLHQRRRRRPGQRRTRRRSWKPRCSKFPTFLRRVPPDDGQPEGLLRRRHAGVRRPRHRGAVADRRDPDPDPVLRSADRRAEEPRRRRRSLRARSSPKPTRWCRRPRDLAKSGVAPTTELAKLLASIKQTGGWDGLVELIYNTTASLNGFDQYGHFGRTLVTLTNCLEYVAAAERGPPAVSPIQRSKRREASAAAPSTAALLRLLQRRARRPKTGGTAAAEGPADRRRPGATRPEPSGEAGVGRASEDRRHRPAPRLPPGAMRNRSGLQGVASSPILVGAVTVLVVIVAVFLAYNANNGLPFVSTYNLKARVPNADALVKGNEVRIGGVRVGIVKSVVPVQLEQRRGRRRTLAQPRQERRTAAGRLDDHDPAEVGARPQVPPGHPRQLLQGLRRRRNDPAHRRQAGTGRHRPVLRHVRQADPRRDPPEPGRLRQRPRRPRPAAERSDRRPAARSSSTASRCCARSSHRAPTSPASGGRSRTSRRRSPRSPRPRRASSSPSTAPSPPSPASPAPTSRKRSKKARRRSTRSTPTCRRCAPSSSDSGRFFTALQPGAKALAETSPMIAESLHAGVPALNASPVLNNQLQPTAEALVDFQEAPGVFNGLDLLTDTNKLLKPGAELHRAGADRSATTSTLAFRNLANASERRQRARATGSTSSPSSRRKGRTARAARPRRPANGPETRQITFTTTPTRKPRAPGQRTSLRSGQREVRARARP